MYNVPDSPAEALLWRNDLQGHRYLLRFRPVCEGVRSGPDRGAAQRVEKKYNQVKHKLLLEHML